MPHMVKAWGDVLESCLEQYLKKTISYTAFIYLCVYFLVPYKPWNYFISFHTVILGFGLIACLVQVLSDFKAHRLKLESPDIFFALSVIFFLVSAWIVHSGNSSFAVSQAYTVSFLSLFFVGYSFRILRVERLYFWIKAYLIASGLLIILQVNFSGGYYVAGFFGQIVPEPGGAGWGFANSHIFAGGAIAWALCVVLARYSINSMIETDSASELYSFVAIGMGAAGVFYTFNRGAWLALALTLGLIFAVILWVKASPRRFIIGAASMVFFVGFFVLTTDPPISRMREKLSFMGSIAKSPGQAIVQDASALTRVKAWQLSLKLIKENPVWGIGLGNYSEIYKKSFAELYKGLNADRFDPNPVQTSSNSYLYYAVEAGTLPAVFLFFSLAHIFSRAMRFGLSPESFPFLTGGVVVCLWMMTCDYIGERIFWIALGAVYGLTLRFGQVVNQEKK